MSCSGLRLLLNSLAIAGATVLVAGCGAKTDRVAFEDIRTTQTAALLPKELALLYLQKIKSQPSSRTGELTIPPCQLTETGPWSGGEYRRRNITWFGTTQSPMDISDYGRWILYRVIDKGGDTMRQADIDRPNVWSYGLRFPKTAKTYLATIDSCMLGPTTEPPRRVVEALVSLGVDISPELAYIVPKR